jgi:hypothetical protein
VRSITHLGTLSPRPARNCSCLAETTPAAHPPLTDATVFTRGRFLTSLSPHARSRELTRMLKRKPRVEPVGPWVLTPMLFPLRAGEIFFPHAALGPGVRAPYQLTRTALVQLHPA